MPVMKKILHGVGLGGQEPEIDYRERPPLVVPASRDLPQPAPADSMAVRSSAWPADQRNAAQHKPAKGDIKTYNPEVAGSGAQPAAQTADPGFASRMWNGVVGFGKTVTGGTEGETTTFTHEPPRTVLTEPPAGYRTPSAAQPYGISSKLKADKSKSDPPQVGAVSK
jgi:hypothetical protein